MVEVFEQGDPVIHKRMTVVRVEGAKVLCKWTDGGEVKERWFDAGELEHYRVASEDWESLEASSDFMTS